MKVEACPVCGNGRDLTPVYDSFTVQGAVFQMVRCNHCRHHFTFFEHDVDLDKYYDEGDYTVKDNRKSIFHRIQHLEYRNVLKTISGLTSQKELLDFGSGKGVFLSFAKEEAFRVAGVETSKPRAAYAKTTFGVEVNTDFYSKGQIFNTRFPIVTMFHVLEHIPDARPVLQNLFSDNLTPNGLAVVEVPNFGSWQSVWAGPRWLHIDIPRHVSHFDDHSLVKLLKDCNLELVKKETFSLHLGIIGMTQTLLSFFGYNGFLVGDLKTRKNRMLMLKVLLTLPVAFVLEGVSSWFGKGGVIRYYLKAKK